MKRSCESPSIPPSDPSPSETALAPEPQPGGGDGAGGDAETALAPEPQHWPERHRRGIDLAVVALVLAYNQLVLPVPAQGPVPWLLEALCPGLALAYLLRRRRPLTAFAVMLLLTWAQLLAAPLGGFLPVDLLLGLMVHHLANTRRRAVSLTAAALVMAWVPIAFAPAVRMGYSRLSLPGLVMIAVAWAWTTGALRRARRDRLAALVDAAEYRLREERARRRVLEREERSRIAREIHDVVSHGLGVMVVVADGAAATASSNPERAAAAMLRVRDTGREALGEMRRMLAVLRDEEPAGPAPGPGAQDLEALVDEARETGLPVRLEVSGGLDLPAGLGLTVYRTVQEGLSNARRHAGAPGRVEVRVDRGPEELVVEVLDDGDGAPPAAAPGETPAGAAPPPTGGHPAVAAPGYGLTGMRERIAAHGGTLEAGPRPGGGFALRAVLPVRTREGA